MKYKIRSIVACGITILCRLFRLKKASWCIGREWGSDRKKRLRDAVYPKDVAAQSATQKTEVP